jgi:rubredoxin
MPKTAKKSSHIPVDRAHPKHAVFDPSHELKGYWICPNCKAELYLEYAKPDGSLYCIMHQPSNLEKMLDDQMKEIHSCKKCKHVIFEAPAGNTKNARGKCLYINTYEFFLHKLRMFAQENKK